MQCESCNQWHTGATPEGVWVQITAAFLLSVFVKEAAEAAPQGETSPTGILLFSYPRPRLLSRLPIHLLHRFHSVNRHRLVVVTCALYQFGDPIEPYFIV